MHYLLVIKQTVQCVFYFTIDLILMGPNVPGSFNLFFFNLFIFHIRKGFCFVLFRFVLF